MLLHKIYLKQIVNEVSVTDGIVMHSLMTIKFINKTITVLCKIKCYNRRGEKKFCC